MGQWTAEDVARIVCNPIYAGLGPFPPIVSREDWIKAAEMSVKEEGLPAFLARMLDVLDEVLTDLTTEPEDTPS